MLTQVLRNGCFQFADAFDQPPTATPGVLSPAGKPFGGRSQAGLVITPSFE